ncbi:DMT family transporter [Paenibacillus sp. BAC0078]
MVWLMLIAAGCFEMLGVAMLGKLHKERGWKTFCLFLLGFGGSLFLLSQAMNSLPMGTAYAVWTGIGASGGAVLGMVLYGEGRGIRRIICIVMILGSAVGLKILG